MHLLLVEDDLDLGASLARALEHERFSIEWVRSAAAARQLFDARRHDAVLLDLGLPDGTGMALLSAWRAQAADTAVLVLTARSALADRLQGLRLGADDFLVKPFAVEELIARIHAVTRRSARQAQDVWQIGSLHIDAPARRVLRESMPVALSPREFDLLVVLARQAGEVVAKHRLAQALAPLGEPLDLNAVEFHVHRLRRKLGTETVHTVRGIGYRLSA